MVSAVLAPLPQKKHADAMHHTIFKEDKRSTPSNDSIALLDRTASSSVADAPNPAVVVILLPARHDNVEFNAKWRLRAR